MKSEDEQKCPESLNPVDVEAAGAYISNGGPLSKISANFEERAVQVALLRKIADGLNHNKICVFEAGTGVGKSFAYLIPAALWALNNKERIVISTGTINLQQQLCEKDIPAVEKILGQKIKFVLMKGRQNYICKRRLSDVTLIRELFEEDQQEIDKIAEWEKQSKTGSKSDLSFMPSDNVWSRVNSESDACMGNRCPFHNECFVMKVRKEAASANLIVVNHHLLFADIEARMESAGYDDAAVLPPYRRIIFDEAHGIESAATSFFSESCTRFKINKLINQMYRKRKNSESGHLCSLAILSSNEEKASSAYDITSRIKKAVLNYELAGSDILQNSFNIRICEKNERSFGPFLVSLHELEKALSEFLDLIHILMEGVSEEDRDAPCYWESKIVWRRLQGIVLLLKDFALWAEHKSYVFWLQKKRLPPGIARDNEQSDFLVINKTPLDISHLMNSGVYEPMDCVVCTSATLKTGRDFNYWMNRNGVFFAEKDRLSIGEFPSPFPYKKNMLLAVPADAPFPDQMEFQQWIEMAIPRLVNASEGRTLILFTAYESLKSAYNATVASMQGFAGRIMKQGDDDNSRLLEAFKKENESVLFATDSFWQGVDIPGESLSHVIIVKLPFVVPNDPVFMARSEAIEMRGGSSFMELSVPEAVIKFRQGIGRLIRRSDDKGVVTVLDRRLFEKRYGSIFMASIPDCKKMYEPLGSVVNAINHFIFE